jgi:flagellar M-ring protein FliF
MIRRLTAPLAPMAGGTAALSASGAPQLTQGPGDAHGQQHAGGSPSQLAAPKRESMIDISQIDGQVRESAIRKVGDVVQAHPEEAMAILRTWLHQPV